VQQAHQQHQNPDGTILQRAVAWLRVSTEEQAKEGRAGLPRQRESALRVAKAKGYQVVEVIEVSDVSGTSTLAAPEMQRLIQMAESGGVDVVIVSEMSRLLRPDDLSSLAILDSFKRAGVLIDVGGSVVDFASPEGFLTGGIQAILGGHERMQLIRKMHASKEERRRSGKCPGSRITLPTGIGYDRKNDAWITTDGIWRVQEAFRLIDEDGLRNIAETGRRVGIKPATMANNLRNPVYKGWRIIDEKRDQSSKVTKADGRQGDRPKIKRAPEDIIRVRVFPEGAEPVSSERWQRVNEILAQISTAWALRTQKGARAHLLSGVGRCGYCGDRLYTKKKAKKTGRLGYYICRTHHEAFRDKLTPCKQGWVSMEFAEELTLAFAREVLGFDDMIADIIGESRRRDQKTVATFPLGGPDIERELASVLKREARLLEAYEGGAITLEVLKERKAKLAEERVRIQKLAEAQENAALAPEPSTLSVVAGRIASGTNALAKAKTDTERRNVLRSIFSEIYFQGDSVTAFMIAPGLLPADGGESFPGIAHGLISLGEPFRPHEPEETVPDGMKRCTKCKEVKPLDGFYRVKKDGEARVARCKGCQNAEAKARHQRNSSEMHRGKR